MPFLRTFLRLLLFDRKLLLRFLPLDYSFELFDYPMHRPVVTLTVGAQLFQFLQTLREVGHFEINFLLVFWLLLDLLDILILDQVDKELPLQVLALVVEIFEGVLYLRLVDIFAIIPIMPLAVYVLEILLLYCLCH